MLTITPPLAVDATHVWVLVTGDGPAVDAARLAYIPATGRFVALPVEAFTTTGALPAYTATGELVAGIRWATTDDIAAHVELFTDTSGGDW